MSIETNEIVVRRFYEELWNQRRLSVADDIFADNCITHQLQSGGETAGAPRGPEEVKQHVREWLSAFPDLVFEVEEMVAQGDLVVSRSVARGSHQGTWSGIKPTGKAIEIRMAVTHRIVGGKIVEDWVLVEALGFFQQLGLVQPTELILETTG